MISKIPHRDKLIAAIKNPKCEKGDALILEEALARYGDWTKAMSRVQGTGKERITDLTGLLNEYKYHLEVELIMKSASPFLIRQKGQLKIDNSVIEEFLIQIIDRRSLDGIPQFDLDIGPQTAFMSMAFMPANVNALGGKPPIEIKDMEPEDCRLTAIDNVLLIRHAKRLPFERRNKYDEVKKHHLDHPIDPEIIWCFRQEIQNFIHAIWYDPGKALERDPFYKYH